MSYTRVLVTLCCLAQTMMLATASRASADDKPIPKIIVGSEIRLVEARETPVLLKLEPAALVAEGGWIGILSTGVQLEFSAGSAWSKGWRLQPSELAGLKIKAPAGSPQESLIIIGLMSESDVLLSTTSANLVVDRAGATTRPGAEVKASALATPAERTPASPTPIDGQAVRLAARGTEQLALGNIAAARLYFRRAADAGLAEAALAMGDTFDAGELTRWGAVGVQPDKGQARRWYEKARELGAGVAASQRLDRLAAR